MEPKETPIVGLKRELMEELELEPTNILPFIDFNFDFTNLGGNLIKRFYFIVEISDTEYKKLKIHEGQYFKLFNINELISIEQKIVPYDSFAIWSYINKERLIFE